MSVSVTTTLAKSVQDAVTTYLQGRTELSLVPVIGRRRLNIISDIQAAITKAGVCIHVFPALPVKLNSNNPGPYVDSLLVRVRAIEKPDINTRGPDCYEVVELLLRLLEGRHFTAVESLEPLYFDSNPVQLVDDSPELVQWDVVAYASAGLTPITS